jgi:hypothetical protein
VGKIFFWTPLCWPHWCSLLTGAGYTGESKPVGVAFTGESRLPGVGYTKESRLTGVAYTGEFPFWLKNTAKIRRNLKPP